MNTNAARDLLHKCLRKSQWPKIHEAEIRVWDDKMNVTKYAQVAFMLSREILNALFKKNPKLNFEDLTAAADSLQQHCQDVTRRYGHTVLPIALWSDAAPYSWDWSSSVEVIMMSLPQLGPPNHTWRFPVTALPKHCVAEGQHLDHAYDCLSCEK